MCAAIRTGRLQAFTSSREGFVNRKRDYVVIVTAVKCFFATVSDPGFAETQNTIHADVKRSSHRSIQNLFVRYTTRSVTTTP
jgi:hypothetical protein